MVTPCRCQSVRPGVLPIDSSIAGRSCCIANTLEALLAIQIDVVFFTRAFVCILVIAPFAFIQLCSNLIILAFTFIRHSEASSDGQSAVQ